MVSSWCLQKDIRKPVIRGKGVGRVLPAIRQRKMLFHCSRTRQWGKIRPKQSSYVTGICPCQLTYAWTRLLGVVLIR